MDTDNNYRPPVKGGTTVFNEDRKPVLATWPQIEQDAPLTTFPPWMMPSRPAGVNGGYDEAELAEAIRQAAGEATLRLLQSLCAGGVSDREVGRRAILRLYKITRESTHAELALRLGVKRSRVTQMLTSLDDKTSNDCSTN